MGGGVQGPRGLSSRAVGFMLPDVVMTALNNGGSLGVSSRALGYRCGGGGVVRRGRGVDGGGVTGPKGIEQQSNGLHAQRWCGIYDDTFGRCLGAWASSEEQWDTGAGVTCCWCDSCLGVGEGN
jgi:hypothetical protein